VHRSWGTTLYGDQDGVELRGYASEKPKVEVAKEGDSPRWLVYWMVEIGAGPPDKDWNVMFRFHHRSEAYGLVANEGGSNAFVFGLKQRF